MWGETSLRFSHPDMCFEAFNFDDFYFVPIGCQDTASPQLKKRLLVIEGDILEFFFVFCN